MVEASYDPAQQVRFDLTRGNVTVKGAGEWIMVPAQALERLCSDAGPQALRNFGRGLGSEAGRRLKDRITSLDQVSPEMFLDHLGGDLALFGLGSLALERWGKALVMTIEGVPVGAQGAELLAAVLEGAFQRALGRDTAVVPVNRDGDKTRLLVAAPEVGAAVRQWLTEGIAWGEVLTRLHAEKEEP